MKKEKIFLTIVVVGLLFLLIGCSGQTSLTSNESSITSTGTSIPTGYTEAITVIPQDTSSKAIVKMSVPSKRYSFERLDGIVVASGNASPGNVIKERIPVNDYIFKIDEGSRERKILVNAREDGGKTYFETPSDISTGKINVAKDLDDVKNGSVEFIDGYEVVDKTVIETGVEENIADEDVKDAVVESINETGLEEKVEMEKEKNDDMTGDREIRILERKIIAEKVSEALKGKTDEAESTGSGEEIKLTPTEKKTVIAKVDKEICDSLSESSDINITPRKIKMRNIAKIESDSIIARKIKTKLPSRIKMNCGAFYVQREIRQINATNAALNAKIKRETNLTLKGLLLAIWRLIVGWISSCMDNLPYNGTTSESEAFFRPIKVKLSSALEKVSILEGKNISNVEKEVASDLAGENTKMSDLTPKLRRLDQKMSSNDSYIFALIVFAKF